MFLVGSLSGSQLAGSAAGRGQVPPKQARAGSEMKCVVQLLEEDAGGVQVSSSM
jgi:hypothetical protein